MIERVDETQLETFLPELIALLKDAVDDGASIGFLPPLDNVEAEAYWQKARSQLADRSRLLLIARSAQELTGTVQLELVTKPNGNHRAEVQKLIVARRFRRQGWGRALMLAAEAAAQEADRHLLMLDTRLGDPSEQLYRSLGYVELGVVPRYARSASGKLDDCIFFYRELDG